MRTTFPRATHHHRQSRVLRTLLVSALLGSPAAAGGQEPHLTTILALHPPETWRERWREQRIPFQDATRFTLVSRTDGLPSGASLPGFALRADSTDSASGLLHEVRVDAPTSARLAWSWRIAEPLDNPRERTRSGDDYAARVLVIFETSSLPLRTRAVNYVWAAHEAPGSIYPGPYGGRVGVVVVRSGGADAGTWQEEERDVLADYRACFGREPEEINAVAVMADTDDTDAAATAWFADLRLWTVPGPAQSRAQP